MFRSSSILETRRINSLQKKKKKQAGSKKEDQYRDS